MLIPTHMEQLQCYYNQLFSWLSLTWMLRRLTQPRISNLQWQKTIKSVVNFFFFLGQWMNKPATFFLILGGEVEMVWPTQWKVVAPQRATTGSLWATNTWMTGINDYRALQVITKMKHYLSNRHSQTKRKHKNPPVVLGRSCGIRHLYFSS